MEAKDYARLGSAPIVGHGDLPDAAVEKRIDALPIALQREIRKGHVSTPLACALSEHAAQLAWLEEHGQCWDQAFVSQAGVALAKGRLGEWLDDCIADRLDFVADEFIREFTKTRDGAAARRFAAQVLIGSNGKLNLSCAEPLSRLLEWCEKVGGTLLSVIRLRVEQFVRDPKLARLFDAIAGRDEGLLKIHPHSLALMEADRHQPGESSLSLQETGQILLGACIWPERQGEVGVCAMVGPQLAVYHSDPRLLLTELKSFVECGVVSMVRNDQRMDLEVPCAMQLSNTELEKSPIGLADLAGQAGILLGKWPSLRRTLALLSGKPLDAAIQDAMVREALLTLSRDETFRDTTGTSMSASMWDICLAAVANEHHLSMRALIDTMLRPLASKDRAAIRLRDAVERTRLGLISCTHSIVSRAWFEVFASAANASNRAKLCDAIVAELFPSRIGEGWPGTAKAKADLHALLMRKCQFLAHEEINGFRLFVRTAAMGDRGSRVTTPEQFAHCVASVIDEWFAEVQRFADGSPPALKLTALKEVEALCRDPAFASRVSGRLLSAAAFKTPWLTNEGVVSTRHVVVDGVRHLSNKPQTVASITYTCDLIDQTLKATASERDRLSGLSDLEKCNVRLGFSARTHRFAILYGQPCWEHLRASSMTSDDWLKQHLSAPGRAWRQQPWVQDELQAAWSKLDQVIPDYDPQRDRQYICEKGGESNPLAFIKVVESLVVQRAKGKDQGRRLELLSLVIAGARRAPLFVVADLNYEGPHALLCLFYDPRLDIYQYVRSSDRLDPPIVGDSTGMPRARELAINDTPLHAEEGGELMVRFW